MLTALPALCRESLILLAYFLCEKNGVEQIVWSRPPRGDPVTLTGPYLSFFLSGGGGGVQIAEISQHEAQKIVFTCSF